MLRCVDKVLTRFNCAIFNSHITWWNFFVMFVLPLVTHVFFWIIIILHRRLHRGLVWLKYSFKMCPTWFMLLNLFFLTIYKPMRIHGNNATQYGNNRLLPINRMTVSSDTYCVRATAAGSNIFPYHSTDIGELSIHGL